jgi:hypothetical protein
LNVRESFDTPIFNCRKVKIDGSSTNSVLKTCKQKGQLVL